MCPPSDGIERQGYWLKPAAGRVWVRTYGHGPRLLIAWHGFGYDGSTFAAWVDTLGAAYRICAPDLPFHGKTTWSKESFGPDDIHGILTAILTKEGAERYRLAGHSLGARLLVCHARTWAERCDYFYLLAPAGIGSFDRVLPIWAQNVVEAALRWTSGLRFFVNLGHRLGWVSNFHRRYAEVQLYPPRARRRLFRIYNSLVHLRTGRPDRKAFWQTTQVPTLVVLAEQDRFVPNAAIHDYFSTNARVDVVTIKANHDSVTAQAVRVISRKA